ncbi:TGS domain-containing protein [archaeon]|jgi:uncharacterized protein|nr:TGS domain-containing protein [archaeon]MBT4241692.1 TGS domain-containing protein [archaeon]MBT4418240.1 TGS domain-containing protein [archaeon]
MPINAHPEYIDAEKEYHGAATNDEKLKALEKMMSTMPKHKGAETLRKNIRRRYKKLKQDIAIKKKKSGSKKGIKKQDMQAILIGLTNSGKSSLLKTLTNAKPQIASYGFTTTEPEIGTLNHKGCSIQIIDMPPIASEHFDKGIINNADTLLIVVEKIDEIKPTLDAIKNKETTSKPKVIIFNKADLYLPETKRKISETLKSKRHNFAIISTITNEGIEELKEKILKSFKFVRVYTKHPGKRDKLDKTPIILKPKSTLKDVAEKILHGYSKKVKYAKVTGPSCKFPNQKVGLKHKVKDKDIVEFFTE